jgi:hypothetical protein
MKLTNIENKKINYNPWPIGKVPKELQRPELDKLKELGYHWDDPRDVVTMFEEKLQSFQVQNMQFRLIVAVTEYFCRYNI